MVVHAYVMGIFKKMAGLNENSSASIATYENPNAMKFEYKKIKRESLFISFAKKLLESIEIEKAQN